jgi:hypothetical protein
VLIAMADQWPRALLRAALREVGYDAVGTRSIATALRIRAFERNRGPVRLLIVDQSAWSGAAAKEFARLLSRHNAPATILLARSTVARPNESWGRVLLRPVSVADVVVAVQEVLPLPGEARHPLD